MTDIAIRDTTAIEPIQQPAQVDPTGGRLVAWAQSLHAAGQLGSALARTPFVPRDFQGKPEACAAAILAGDEIGLTPMQSLQSVYVVSGRPGLYARAMVAVVLAAGHEVWVEVSTDARVTVSGRRRGSEHVTTSTWDQARARKAGYTSNKKYDSDPQAMLYARAASDVCRRIAPDALAGLSYSVEELELEEPAPTRSVTRTEPASRQVGRRAAPKPAAEEPALDEEPEPPAQAQAHTPAQMRKMQALFSEAGLTEQASKRAYASDVIGRELASATDMTREEMARVIDALESDSMTESADPDLDGAEAAAEGN